MEAILRFDIEKFIGDLSRNEHILKYLVDMLALFVLQVAKKMVVYSLYLPTRY